MNTHRTCDFDVVIQKAIREFENKYKCMVFVLSDNENWYMSAINANGIMFSEVKMCELQGSKYQLATAMRRHFRTIQ